MRTPPMPESVSIRCPAIRLPRSSVGYSARSVVREMRRYARMLLAGAVVLVAAGTWATERGSREEILGTWRGTSTCINLKVTPACKDETVVSEIRASEKPKAVVLNASKIVDGKQLPMGELEFVFSDEEGCWRSEFNTANAHAVWCLVVAGQSMTGGLRMLPENADVRKVQVMREMQ